MDKHTRMDSVVGIHGSGTWGRYKQQQQQQHALAGANVDGDICTAAAHIVANARLETTVACTSFGLRYIKLCYKQLMDRSK